MISTKSNYHVLLFTTYCLAPASCSRVPIKSKMKGFIVKNNQYYHFAVCGISCQMLISITVSVSTNPSGAEQTPSELLFSSALHLSWLSTYLFSTNFHYYRLSPSPLHTHIYLWETHFDLILVFTVATEIEPESLCNSEWVLRRTMYGLAGGS